MQLRHGEVQYRQYGRECRIGHQRPVQHRELRDRSRRIGEGSEEFLSWAQAQGPFGLDPQLGF
jgi:hypothetical protein